MVRHHFCNFKPHQKHEIIHRAVESKGFPFQLEKLHLSCHLYHAAWFGRVRIKSFSQYARMKSRAVAETLPQSLRRACSCAADSSNCCQHVRINFGQLVIPETTPRRTPAKFASFEKRSTLIMELYSTYTIKTESLDFCTLRFLS